MADKSRQGLYEIYAVFYLILNLWKRFSVAIMSHLSARSNISWFELLALPRMVQIMISLIVTVLMPLFRANLKEENNLLLVVCFGEKMLNLLFQHVPQNV